MENGYIILGIVALLFLAMYGYSCFSVVMENIIQKRKQRKQLQKEALRHLKRLKNQEIIDERVKAFNKRKEEIQHQLKLLREFNEKRQLI